MPVLKYIWNGKFLGIPGALQILLKSSLMQFSDRISTIVIRNNFNKTGKNISIHLGVIYRYPNKISLGNNITIGRKVKLLSENPNGFLTIEDNVEINYDTQIDFSGGLKIGKNTLISKSTIIETHDHGLNPHNEPTFRSLDIGENVWIGMHAMILSNVRKIGANSVIAAGSVVTKEVPANTLVGGVPAHIIRKI
jgi:acetyltransferase-like isoleucine patch superfamily enzyme